MKELKLNIKYKSSVLNMTLAPNDPRSEQINETRIIPLRRLRWWIDVPINLLSGKRIWIQMLADTAADTPCANLIWAAQYYKRYILMDKKPKSVETGGGVTYNKYCMYFTFPTSKKAICLKCKFILLPNLPAPILADINMLIAFDFTFKRVVPPLFRHLAKEDKDLKIKEADDKFKMNKIDIKKNWQNLNKLLKDKGPLFYDVIMVGIDR